MNLIIVDDEEVTRNGLKKIIDWSSLGIKNIMEASDGVEALNIMEKYKPDIVLTDVRMPKMDGIELANRIREEVPYCQLVFISGYSEKEYLRSAIKLKAVDFIDKPVNVKELQVVIRKAINDYVYRKKKLNEESKLKKDFQQNLQMRRGELLKKIIIERIDKKEINRELEQLNVYISKDCFCSTVLIKMDPQVSTALSKTERFRETLLMIIEKCLSQSYEKYILTYFDKGDIAILIANDNIDNVWPTIDFCKELSNNLNDYIGYEKAVSVIIGKVVRGVENFIESYKSVCKILKTQFYLGYGSIIFYNEENESRIYHYDKRIEKKFVELLDDMDFSSLVELVKKTTRDISKYIYTDTKYIKDIFFRFTIYLYKQTNINLQYSFDKNQEGQYIWEVIQQLGTLKEVESYLLDRINSISKHIEDENNKKSVVYRIIEYIEEHYCEDIKIKMIAEHIFFTHTYLCQIFRKTMNKTINQYIIELRMNKARTLLKNRNLKLYQIADMVGYKDPNYFAKVFKKQYGVNPSECR